MSENVRDRSIDEQARALMRAGAAAELHLLKEEQKAERRLAATRAVLAEEQRRLERAQQRVDSSRRAVAEAAALLRECQLRRAAGPPRPED